MIVIQSVKKGVVNGQHLFCVFEGGRLTIEGRNQVLVKRGGM